MPEVSAINVAVTILSTFVLALFGIVVNGLRGSIKKNADDISLCFEEHKQAYVSKEVFDVSVENLKQEMSEVKKLSQKTHDAVLTLVAREEK